MFYKDSDVKALRIKDKTDDDGKFTLSDADASNDTISSTDNFIVARTPLRKGYIYLINDENINDFHELEVDESGMFSHIIWSGNNLKEDGRTPKDFRTKEKKTTHYKLIQQTEKEAGKKYWICYSPVQWSYEYHKNMLDDVEKRRPHMILVECKGIKKSEEETTEHILPYNKVPIAYYKDQTNQYKIKETLTQTDQIEKREEKKGNNDTYEDLFITLHDPIGAANDIASILIDEHNKHESLIESIQTGTDSESIFERIKSGKQKPSSQSNYETQVNGLFSSALTTYQLIYNNAEMEDKYADTTDKNKLLKILAVTERRQQRAKIDIIRNEFGNLISGTYYDEYLNSYLEKSDNNVFQANFWIASQLSLLAIHPHHRDRQIDLQNEYTGKNDPWASFIKSTLDTKSNIGKLLEKEIKLENLEENPVDAAKGYGISAKLITSFEALMGGYASHVTRKTDFEVLLKYVKSFKYKGETVISIRQGEASRAVGKSGFNLNKSKLLTENKLLKGAKKGHKFLFIKTTLNEAEIGNIIANKNITLPVQGQGGSAKAKWLFKVMDSSRFKAFIAGLEAISLALTVKDYNKKSDIKNFINSAGAFAGLAAASGNYAEARMLARGHVAGKGVVGFVGNAAKIAGFVGAGVGVFMCLWDCKDSYQARDFDASVTWGLTGALSAVLLADGLIVFAGGTFLTFWPMAIILGLVVIGVIIAIYLTDSPLEKFLKNNVLSSDNLASPGNALPHAFIKDVYDKRDDWVDNEFKDWRNFEKASRDLYDLLVSYRVEHQNEDSYSAMHDPENDKDKGLMDYIREALQMYSGIAFKATKKFKIKVNLRKFIYNKSEFDFALKFYLRGTQNQQGTQMLLACHTEIKTTDEGQDVLELTYELPRQLYKKISLASEFVFISRTIINEKLNEYWPHEDKGARYMAYKFNATDWLAPKMGMKMAESMETAFGTNIRIGSEEEVFSSKTWKQ